MTKQEPIKVWYNNLKKSDRGKIKQLIIHLLTRKNRKIRFCNYARICGYVDYFTRDIALQIQCLDGNIKTEIYFSWRPNIKRFNRIGRKNSWPRTKFVHFRNLPNEIECLMAIISNDAFTVYKNLVGKRASCRT